MYLVRPSIIIKSSDMVRFGHIPSHFKIIVILPWKNMNGHFSTAFKKKNWDIIFAICLFTIAAYIIMFTCVYIVTIISFIQLLLIFTVKWKGEHTVESIYGIV